MLVVKMYRAADSSFHRHAMSWRVLAPRFRSSGDGARDKRSETLRAFTTRQLKERTMQLGWLRRPCLLLLLTPCLFRARLLRGRMRRCERFRVNWSFAVMQKSRAAAALASGPFCSGFRRSLRIMGSWSVLACSTRTLVLRLPDRASVKTGRVKSWCTS